MCIYLYMCMYCRYHIYINVYICYKNYKQTSHQVWGVGRSGPTNNSIRKSIHQN